MRTVPLGLLFLACSAAAADAPDRDLPPSVLFTRLAPSTVVVEAKRKDERSQGSGVVVGREEVVTNHHVVEGGQVIRVRQGERSWTATVVAVHPERDLALLRVPGLDLPRASPRPSTVVKVGERVYALGAPRGLELSLSDGLVSALRPEKKGRDGGPWLIQTTAPISPGSSGGGLFDAQGRLVGVTTLKVEGENLNFAVPTEWITELRSGLAGGAPPPRKASPRYSLTERPRLLRCAIRTRATWGLFSGGNELLESKPVNEVWEFSSFESQLPIFVPEVGPRSRLSLVLADLNRQVGFARFTATAAERGTKTEFFVSVDEDGNYQVSALDPVDFHGQLRVIVTSGACEVPVAKPPRPVADANATCKAGNPQACIAEAQAVRARDRVRALSLLMRGCDADIREACEKAAELCDELDHVQKARELRERAGRIP